MINRIIGDGIYELLVQNWLFKLFETIMYSYWKNSVSDCQLDGEFIDLEFEIDLATTVDESNSKIIVSHAIRVAK